MIEGIYFLKEKLNIDRVIICIESNKEKAINKLYTIAADKRDKDDTVKLMKLPTSYPQGAESWAEKPPAAPRGNSRGFSQSC